jgi:NAD(P)-dependent dehydrogenase (short-subunit alcohol dehydrogenase family)
MSWTRRWAGLRAVGWPTPEDPGRPRKTPEDPDGDDDTELNGRNTIADEIAAAVVYLASAEAEWASGAVLDLNGASYLR